MAKSPGEKSLSGGNARLKFAPRPLTYQRFRQNALMCAPVSEARFGTRQTSFGNRWAQEGKIPALPFDRSFPAPRAPWVGRVGSAGNVMDCAWII
jgi:hypothetical protein